VASPKKKAKPPNYLLQKKGPLQNEGTYQKRKPSRPSQKVELLPASKRLVSPKKNRASPNQQDRAVKGQVQPQPHPIWPKRLVLEKTFSTPPCGPSIDAKFPSSFRSACGRGHHLLPTCPINKSDAIGFKIVKNPFSEAKQKAARGENNEIQGRRRIPKSLLQAVLAPARRAPPGNVLFLRNLSPEKGHS
jgi:hypothetical protein